MRANGVQRFQSAIRHLAGLQLGRALSISIGVVLIGGCLYGSAAAAVDPSESAGVVAIQQAFAYVPDYLSAPAIQSGSIVDSDGHPVDGATVILFPLLRKPARGTVVPAVSRAITNDKGQYSLHLPTSEKKSLTSKWTGGAANLHIVAFYPNSLGDWLVPIPAGQTYAAAATITIHALSSSQSIPDSPSNPPGCHTPGSPKTIGAVKQIVGYKSSLDPKLRSAVFSYSTGYSVTAGAGVSYTGKYGDLSASGSTTTTASETINYIDLSGAGSNYYEADSYWNWQEYICGVNGHGQRSHAEWLLTETNLGGSAGTPKAKAVPTKRCYSSQNLKSVTFDRSTQATWTLGADLTEYGFDINLSAQDGYTTDASLTYNFDWQANDYPAYCGVNGYPGTNSAGYVQVHK